MCLWRQRSVCINISITHKTFNTFLSSFAAKSKTFHPGCQVEFCFVTQTGQSPQSEPSIKLDPAPACRYLVLSMLMPVWVLVLWCASLFVDAEAVLFMQICDISAHTWSLGRTGEPVGLKSLNAHLIGSRLHKMLYDNFPFLCFCNILFISFLYVER